MPEIIPRNETERLHALRALELVRTPPQPEFDAIVRLAATLFDCPTALVSLVDEHEQWFKARCGMEAEGTPRHISFCAHAILSDDIMVISDATKDERFRDSPLVVDTPNIRFYAGCPLSLDGRNRLGTLCVLDAVPKQPSDKQLLGLKRLGIVVEGLIRAHGYAVDATRTAEWAHQQEADLKRHSGLLEQIADVSGVGGWELEVATSELTWTAQTKAIHEVPPDYQPNLETATDFYADEGRQHIIDAVEKGMATGEPWDLELPFVTAKGRRTWIRAVGKPIFEDGVLVRLIGAIQDISDAKSVEATIRQKSEELEVTLANMNQGVSAFDGEANLVLWNRQYIDIFEKRDGEVFENARFSDLLEAEKSRGDFDGDIPSFIAELRNKMASGKTVRARFKLANGKVISSVHAPLPHGGWVGTHEDVTLREQAVERVRHAADHDMLTGLANRSRFNLEIGSRVQMARASGQSGTLMLIDLDHFKEVNDTHGHLAGDEVLVEVSRRLRLLARDDDFLARLGGDEFALLLKAGTHSYDAARIAGEIVARLGLPFTASGNEIEIGASVGVAFTWQADCNADLLLSDADAALYKVKEAGRSGYRLFDEDLKREVTSRRHLARDLAEAVRSRKLDLYFQPIVSTRDNTLIGHEALLRWKNGDGDFIPPSTFIPIAEQTGCIVELGLWVVETGIREAANWPETEKLFLNISPRQLGDGNLCDTIAANLERFGISPARLEVEVTESVLLDDDESRLACLHEIKDLGVSIALDDFGTGYSSLSRLHSFPFDRLKIDRLFVSGLGHDAQSATIVSSVANLAMSFGLKSTAEGVETEEQMKLVTLAGCTSAQGYLFGRAVPGEEIAELRARINATNCHLKAVG